MNLENLHKLKKRFQILKMFINLKLIHESKLIHEFQKNQKNENIKKKLKIFLNCNK